MSEIIQNDILIHYSNQLKTSEEEVSKLAETVNLLLQLTEENWKGKAAEAEKIRFEEIRKSLLRVTSNVGEVRAILGQLSNQILDEQKEQEEKKKKENEKAKDLIKSDKK